MTLEVYIGGALSYRINGWEPSREGDSISDGRQIAGAWLETWVYAWSYEARGNSWCCNYWIKARIPPGLRLDRSDTSIAFTSNPGGIPQPNPASYRYGASAIGPTTIDGVRVQNVNGHDEQDYNGMGIWRTIVKLYFTRITHTILRDPDHGNRIMRAPYNVIMRNA